MKLNSEIMIIDIFILIYIVIEKIYFILFSFENVISKLDINFVAYIILNFVISVLWKISDYD